MARAPVIASLLGKCCTPVKYKAFVWILTFLCYMSYHLSRKPITVVTNVLHNTSCSNASGTQFDPNCTTSWAPFANNGYVSALSAVYLFAYAVGMFASGHIAERMDLRYFLSIGMTLSGLLTAAFGLGYLLKIHSIVFFLTIQVLTGLVQSTGWPAVVTVMGNWYGKSRRGFIMGVWNAHTSVGNILGGLIASAFLSPYWETRGYWFLSFAVCGGIIFILGIVIFFTLVPEPQAVGLPSPNNKTSLNGDSTAETDSLLPAESVSSADGSDDLTSHRSHENVPSEARAIQPKSNPIGFIKAFQVPGVLEFSFSLFFAKLVSYTFLYWLPFYIKHKMAASATSAGDLASLFDVGGIPGAILAGVAADLTGSSALVCAGLVLLSTPMMFLYESFGYQSYTSAVILLMVTGALVNGPYCLITTSVSADLGTHPSLRSSAKALSTVTAIIDGTGSVGAALGPLIAYMLGENYDAAFYLLIGANLMSMLLLSRLVVKDIQRLVDNRRLKNLRD